VPDAIDFETIALPWNERRSSLDDVPLSGIAAKPQAKPSSRTASSIGIDSEAQIGLDKLGLHNCRDNTMSQHVHAGIGQVGIRS
jgi:hypothetical protein